MEQLPNIVNPSEIQGINDFRCIVGQMGTLVMVPSHHPNITDIDLLINEWSLGHTDVSSKNYAILTLGELRHQLNRTKALKEATHPLIRILNYQLNKVISILNTPEPSSLLLRSYVNYQVDQPQPQKLNYTLLKVFIEKIFKLPYLAAERTVDPDNFHSITLRELNTLSSYFPDIFNLESDSLALDKELRELESFATAYFLSTFTESPRGVLHENANLVPSIIQKLLVELCRKVYPTKYIATLDYSEVCHLINLLLQVFPQVVLLISTELIRGWNGMLGKNLSGGEAENLFAIDYVNGQLFISLDPTYTAQRKAPMWQDRLGRKELLKLIDDLSFYDNPNHQIFMCLPAGILHDNFTNLPGAVCPVYGHQDMRDENNVHVTYATQLEIVRQVFKLFLSLGSEN